MTALIGNLPDRSTTTAGNLRVLYSTGENNVFNNTHVTDARAKNWLPYKYNGTNWTEIAATLIGDVNNDGKVNITDVTYLINLLLSNANPPAEALNELHPRHKTFGVQLFLSQLQDGRS